MMDKEYVAAMATPADIEQMEHEAYERGRLEGRAWYSFMDRDPEALQIILVFSEIWKFPKVLQFVPWGAAHRLVEVEGERFYYYPERMHWMPIPPKP